MKNVRGFLAVCTVAVSLSTEAIAQADPNIRDTTGRPLKPITAPVSDGKELPSETLWRKIREAALPDLKYAEALAKNIGTERANARAECYTGLIKANEQANGTGIMLDGKPLGNPPEPHLITGFEQAAEIIDNLAPDSPVMLACAKTATLMRQSVLQVISALISGAAIIPKPVP